MHCLCHAREGRGEQEALGGGGEELIVNRNTNKHFVQHWDLIKSYFVGLLAVPA